MQVPSACVGGSADGSLLTQTNVERVLSLATLDALFEALSSTSSLTQEVFEQGVKTALVIGDPFPDLLDDLVAGLKKIPHSYKACMRNAQS